MTRSTGLTLLTVILLFHATSSAQWTQVNNPGGGRILTFVVTGTSILAGSDSGVFRSTDDGQTWLATDSSRTVRFVTSLQVLGDTLFAGTFGGGVFRSTDGGASWTTANGGLTSTNVFDLLSSGTSLFAGTDNGVFRSTNNGASWVSSSSGIPDSWVTSLGVQGMNLFASVEGWRLFRSTDDGESWTRSDSGMAGAFITSFVVAGSTLFAGGEPLTGGGGVFGSSDGGTTWTSADSGLTGGPVKAIVVERGNLFAGTDYGNGGVFVSSNHGDSWSLTSGGTSLRWIEALAVCGDYLIASATDQNTGRGEVWRRPLDEMITGVDGRTSSMPSSIALEQNYPNPFNPVTTITFAIPHDAGRVGTRLGVSVMVYDLLGRPVATLVDDTRAPGAYSVTFDASKLSTGTYIYRLTAGGFTATRRMTLVR
jgi:photosystem II stability/assembly factor-like uncharacterized protein